MQWRDVRCVLAVIFQIFRHGEENGPCFFSCYSEVHIQNAIIRQLHVQLPLNLRTKLFRPF